LKSIKCGSFDVKDVNITPDSELIIRSIDKLTIYDFNTWKFLHEQNIHYTVLSSHIDSEGRIIMINSDSSLIIFEKRLISDKNSYEEV